MAEKMTGAKEFDKSCGTRIKTGFFVHTCRKQYRTYVRIDDTVGGGYGKKRRIVLC